MYTIEILLCAIGTQSCCSEGTHRKPLGTPLGNPFRRQRKPLAHAHTAPFLKSVKHRLFRSFAVAHLHLLCLGMVAPCMSLMRQNWIVRTEETVFPTFCRALPCSVRDEMFGNRNGRRTNTYFLFVCTTLVAVQCVHVVYMSLGLVMFAPLVLPCVQGLPVSFAPHPAVHALLKASPCPLCKSCYIPGASTQQAARAWHLHEEEGVRCGTFARK